MLGKIKLLLGIPKEDTAKDELLTYLLETTVAKILSYCRIKTLPQPLEHVAVEITVTRYHDQQQDTSTDKVVKALTVGGVRTEFADSKAGQGIGQYIDSYKEQLNRYKRTLFL